MRVVDSPHEMFSIWGLSMGHSFVYCWSGKFPNDFKYSGHYRPVIIIVSERLPNLIETKTTHHQTPGSSGKDGKRQLENTLWKTYSRSKTAHNEWKQNDEQRHGLLKLSFAKHKLLQHRPERAIHGCLKLIFSCYLSSRSIWVLPRDLDSPCASPLYQVSCLHPNPRGRRKANYSLNMRQSAWMRPTWHM